MHLVGESVPRCEPLMDCFHLLPAFGERHRLVCFDGGEFAVESARVEDHPDMAFDYLRDNLRYWPDELIQSGLHAAIVDEADHVLIDEGRTPLIISGQ